MTRNENYDFKRVVWTTNLACDVNKFAQRHSTVQGVDVSEELRNIVTSTDCGSVPGLTTITGNLTVSHLVWVSWFIFVAVGLCCYCFAFKVDSLLLLMSFPSCIGDGTDFPTVDVASFSAAIISDSVNDKVLRSTFHCFYFYFTIFLWLINFLRLDFIYRGVIKYHFPNRIGVRVPTK